MCILQNIEQDSEENTLDTLLFFSYRIHGVVGDEAEARREHSPAAGGRVRGDGGRHQGGRGDRRLLPAQEDSPPGQPQS